MLKKIAQASLVALLATSCVYEEPEPSPSPEVTPTATDVPPTATPVAETPTATPVPTSPTPCSDCDEDGVAADTDCDDENASVYPGAHETLCDGIDQDCDGQDGTLTDQLVCQDGSCTYSSIKAAVNDVPADTVVNVCPGTYKESNIEIDDGELTIRSVYGPTVTTIDANNAFATAVRFVGGGMTGTYGLDGFTVKGARPTLYGGGLYVETSSPIITNCIIENNTAGLLGAGVYLAGSNATFRHVTIRNNASSDDGGGVYIFGGSPVFENSVIENNSANDEGGGVSMDGSSAAFNNVIFRYNTADDGGGAVEMQGTATPSITNSLFVGNFAGDGHAIFTASSEAHPVVQFSVFVGNGLTTSSRVGKVARSSISALPGTVVLDIGEMTMQHSIVAYNGDCNVSVSAAAIALTDSDLYAKDGNCNTNGFTAGSTVLTSEPGFLTYDSASGMPKDFHLALSSPLINKGASGFVDVDNSVADFGIYGGANGGDWDMDNDTLNGYFWPGACTDVPGGFDGSAYDCDDLTPNL